MSNQNSWNKGWQDAFSGKGQANMANQNSQVREAYEAAHKLQRQEQQLFLQRLQNQTSRK